MKCLELELHEYICDYCISKGISLELRWRCFGDLSGFYINNEMFAIACCEYYASDVEDIKYLMTSYIDAIWEDEETWENISRSNYRIVIYVADIVDMDGWYKVVIGGAISDV